MLAKYDLHLEKKPLLILLVIGIITFFQRVENLPSCYGYLVAAIAIGAALYCLPHRLIQFLSENKIKNKHYIAWSVIMFSWFAAGFLAVAVMHIWAYELTMLALKVLGIAVWILVLALHFFLKFERKDSVFLNLLLFSMLLALAL